MRIVLEKRRWRWVAAVVVAIYAGLALAGNLALAMPESALHAATFGLCFLVVVVAVIGNGLSCIYAKTSSGT